MDIFEIQNELLDIITNRLKENTTLYLSTKPELYSHLREVANDIEAGIKDFTYIKSELLDTLTYETLKPLNEQFLYDFRDENDIISNKAKRLKKGL